MFEESQQIGSIFLLATCISFPVKIPNMAKNVAILISYYGHDQKAGKKETVQYR